MMTFPKRAAALAGLLCVCGMFPAGADELPELVRDINPGPFPQFSTPVWLTDLDGLLIFGAFAPVIAQEPFRSDGTSSGTEFLRDIQPAGNSFPQFLTRSGRYVFFAADDWPANGYELWRTDGTSSGTELVRDINPGPESSFDPPPSSLPYLTDVDGTLFFSASDGGDTITDKGRELWKSDGTAGGTVLVKDINAGQANSTPRFITEFNGQAFFAATDSGFLGQELWRSDGTGGGTTVVFDINPTGDSLPDSLAAVGGMLYFAATGDLAVGQELWKSDGTGLGTTLVADINPGNRNSNPNQFVESGGIVFFTAISGSGRELWKTDGTAAGTQIVRDINPGNLNSDPIWLTDVDGTLFFIAYNGTFGNELWKSDGTLAGTQIVKDIRSGSSSSVNPPLGGWLTNVNGTLFFAAATTLEGYELWKSDGSSAGTQRVLDLYVGPNPSTPEWLTNIDGTLFMSAIDDLHGRELFRTIVHPKTTVIDPEPAFTSGTQNTIAWAPRETAVQYEVQVSLSPDFDVIADSAVVASPTLSASFFGLGDGLQYYYRVRSENAEFAIPGNWSAVASTTQDDTAPTGTLAINGGDAGTTDTNVTLSLAGFDGFNGSGVVDMQFSNDGVGFGPWVPFAATAAWTLDPGEGLREVFVNFRDGVGRVSTGTISDTIALDNTAPTGALVVNADDAFATTTAVTLNLSGDDGPEGSGVTEVQFSNDGVSFSPFQPFAPTAPWTLAPGDGPKTVYARYRDAVGFLSVGTITDDVRLDTVAPDGTVLINNDATYATTTSVVLQLAAGDGGTSPSGVAQVSFRNDGGAPTAFEAFATTRAWTLEPTNGIRQVSVVYRDLAGNPSTTTLDTIRLDTVLPLSAVMTTTGTTSARQFPLTWSFEDPGTSPTGVVAVDVFWRKDAGPYNLVGSFATTQTSTLFDVPIQLGNGVYEFLSLSTDAAGNREADPGTPDVGVTYFTGSEPGAWTVYD